MFSQRFDGEKYPLSLCEKDCVSKRSERKHRSTFEERTKCMGIEFARNFFANDFADKTKEEMLKKRNCQAQPNVPLCPNNPSPHRHPPVYLPWGSVCRGVGTQLDMWLAVPYRTVTWCSAQKGHSTIKVVWKNNIFVSNQRGPIQCAMVVARTQTWQRELQGRTLFSCCRSSTSHFRSWCATSGGGCATGFPRLRASSPCSPSRSRSKQVKRVSTDWYPQDSPATE